MEHLYRAQHHGGASEIYLRAMHAMHGLLSVYTVCCYSQISIAIVKLIDGVIKML